MNISVNTKQKSRLSGYTASALVLAGAGMVSKILGAIYRIPLTNILGAKGIGMYQLVFPIYALMLTLSSSGIPTAISRMISEKRALGEFLESRKIMKSAFILLFCLGGVAMVVMYLISAPLAGLQGNNLVKFGYYAVAPSILIVAISSFFKGWFQGNMNMMPTAMAQITEQVFKMVFGLLFAYYLLPKGVINAVVGALIGLTIAEFLSMSIMAIMYLSKRQKGLKQVAIDMSTTKELVKVSLPIMASGLIFPITQFVDSMLIVNLLSLRGVSKDIAISQYGILSAPVNSLINMPIVITLAFAVAIVPIISSKRALKDSISIKQKSVLAVKLSFLIGMPCFLAIFVLAKPLMASLYPALTDSNIQLATMLLRVSSANVILLSLSQVFTSLMQALGKSSKPIFILLFTAMIKIFLDIILIVRIGIVGASIASVVAYTVCVVACWWTLRRLLGEDKKLIKNVSKIMLISAIIGLIIFSLSFIKLSRWWTIILSIVIAVPIYLGLVLLSKVFNEEELQAFPFGNTLTKLHKMVRKDKKERNYD